MGLFGQAANSVSLVFSLLGTSFVIRRLGVRLTLMLFPVTLIIAVRTVYAAPSMWVLFSVMVSIKVGALPRSPTSPPSMTFALLLP